MGHLPTEIACRARHLNNFFKCLEYARGFAQGGGSAMLTAGIDLRIMGSLVPHIGGMITVLLKEGVISSLKIKLLLLKNHIFLENHLQPLVVDEHLLHFVYVYIYFAFTKYWVLHIS